MSKHFRVAIWIVVLLLIVAAPFIAIGTWFEPAIERWLATDALRFSLWQSAIAIIGLLAVDIALPIPSSGVCTFAGRELGWIAGGVVNWIGLNVSSLIGYWIGRHPGRWFARRFSDAATMERLAAWSDRSATMCLLICRPLPLLAEASVILMGVRRLPPRQFWPPVLIANLVLGIGYAAFGHFAAANDTFWPALFASLLLPLIFVLAWRASAKNVRKSLVQ